MTGHIKLVSYSSTVTMMHGPIYIRLRRVFEQSVNRRAVTMLRYTRCNVVILMAATEWLMLSFSSFSPGRREENFSLGTLEKYGIRIKSAHDTGTRICSHHNHYFTSGIPQNDSTCAAVY